MQKNRVRPDDDEAKAKVKLVDLVLNTPPEHKRELSYIRKRDAFVFALSDTIDFLCKEDNGEDLALSEFFIGRQLEYNRSINGRHILSAVGLAELELGNYVDEESGNGYEPPR